MSREDLLALVTAATQDVHAQLLAWAAAGAASRVAMVHLAVPTPAVYAVLTATRAVANARATVPAPPRGDGDDDGGGSAA